MGMWIDRQDIDVQRQPEIIADLEVALAGGNSKCAVMLELKQHGKFGLWFAREVQSHRRLYDFRFSRRLHMNVQHQIVAGVETPCKTVRLHHRTAAGLPEEKVAVRVKGTTHQDHVHSGESL